MSAPKIVFEAVRQTFHITVYEKVCGQTSILGFYIAVLTCIWEWIWECLPVCVCPKYFGQPGDFKNSRIWLKFYTLVTVVRTFYYYYQSAQYLDTFHWTWWIDRNLQSVKRKMILWYWENGNDNNKIIIIIIIIIITTIANI